MKHKSLVEFIRKRWKGKKMRSKNESLFHQFEQDYKHLEAIGQNSKKRFLLDRNHLYPCLNDKTSFTPFDKHYVYHPAWAARVINKYRPTKHIDISSTVYFCSIVSAFVPVDFYDYRPANLQLSGLQTHAGDLMKLPFESNTVESISCMHTIEHIGLGRYGDPIDYDGDIKAIQELKRVIAPGGSLLFVVPLGSQDVIYFNAHRIYSKAHVLSLFQDMQLKEFTLIPEDDQDGGLVIDPSDELLSKQNYGCGCFWFVKDNHSVL